MTDTLLQANPILNPGMASWYAERIIRRNDVEAYEDAWTQLRMALTSYCCTNCAKRSGITGLIDREYTADSV